MSTNVVGHQWTHSVKALVNRSMLGVMRLAPIRFMKHLCFLLRANPRITDRWGVHVRLIHYYEPLPDFARLTAEQVKQRRVPRAVEFNLDGQIELVRRLGARFREELVKLASAEKEEFDFENDYFAGLDAAVYYALLRDLRPAQVIEIGSGYSTRIAALALRTNATEGKEGRLSCIEPYPEPRLTNAKLDIELVKEPVENVDLEMFTRLSSGDVLFIDSSHAIKFGGDVCREFLEILPLLKPGVWIHVHDVFFPHDYPAEWVLEKRFAFNEQYMLEAFLSYNRSYSVRLSNYWLALEHVSDAAVLWPDIGKTGSRHGAASFWMRKEV